MHLIPYFVSTVLIDYVVVGCVLFADVLPFKGDVRRSLTWPVDVARSVASILMEGRR